MALLFGTEEGVYRASEGRIDEVTRVIDAGRVMRVDRFPPLDDVFACSKTGLYRSENGGRTWSNLGVPRDEVYSVCLSPDRERLYAGTHPAHLYVSDDTGESWRELEGFQELPSRAEWFTPRHRNEAHIRSLNVHPDEPDRVIAGVEVGGVHVSDDRGETWTERRDGLQDDVHHVLVLAPTEYVASCGDGLYRTRDAGRNWTRLDGDLSGRYFREACAYDGRLYAAAARDPPGTWKGEFGANAGLFVSEDGGDTFTTVSYPGEPREILLAWDVLDGSVIAGTNGGRLIREETGGWETICRLTSGIRSLCVV